MRKPTAPSAPKKSFFYFEFFFFCKFNSHYPDQKKKKKPPWFPPCFNLVEPAGASAHPARVKRAEIPETSPCFLVKKILKKPGGMHCKSRDQPHTLPVSPTCFDIDILALLPRPRVSPGRVSSVRGRRRPRNRPEGSAGPCKRQQLRFTSIPLCPPAPPWVFFPSSVTLTGVSR